MLTSTPHPPRNPQTLEGKKGESKSIPVQGDEMSKTGSISQTLPGAKKGVLSFGSVNPEGRRHLTWTSPDEPEFTNWIRREGLSRQRE